MILSAATSNNETSHSKNIMVMSINNVLNISFPKLDKITVAVEQVKLFNPFFKFKKKNLQWHTKQ